VNETEKLRRAVEIALEAGYQLNNDAFEFLNLTCATDDPEMIICKAVTKLNSLDDKPLFIERGFLEELLRPYEPLKEPETAAAKEATMTEPDALQAPSSTPYGAFEPYSKHIEADLKVIDDPGSRISSGGTIDDFLKYFQDRFKQTETLLRQRIDVKSATTILDALKTQANTRLKIIGIVTEKRESKQRTILTLEDLKAHATVLVPANAPTELQKKARSLMLDQVICASVARTKSSLFIVDDIILPEVPQKIPHKASIPAYAVLTSDMHVGSTKFTREAFKRFLLWLNGKYGDDRMKEIAAHVKYVLVAGDIIDGVGVYPNQAKELAIRDVYKQYKTASRYIEQIPDYVEVIVTPGNHDTPRKALPQPAIQGSFLEALTESRRIHSLGNPCTVSLHGVEVLIYHGRSLDDVVSTVPEMTHSHPERAMRLLLQSRHLAPTYGGKTPISPENRDSLVISHVPDIFHAGHVHAMEHGNYRGVLVVNSGCWQEQTDYMKRNGFMPTPAIVPIVNLQTLEVTDLQFNEPKQ
jgi:DNA polymerase II small subunit